MAALRRHTPDVCVGSGCVEKEVKSCVHHEMVATSYGIYPRREHGSMTDDAKGEQVAVETNDLDQ